MEERPPLKTLMFVNLAILLVFFVINVESQQRNRTQSNVLRPSPSPSPHSPSPAPSPHMPPHLHHLHSSRKSPNQLNTNSQSSHHLHKKDGFNFNLGQKIGLLFASIVAIMQVGVVGFLAFKRRQLLKMDDR